jgi:ferredoxin-NADP reductase/ferredoxin
MSTIKELGYWLQDLRAYRRVSRNRKALRQPGRGIDHVAQETTVQELVARMHPERMQLRVLDVMQATPSTKTFRLERLDGSLPPFRPGQYLNVFVDVDGVLTSRPYSIASPPPGDGGSTLELTIRDNPGGFVAPYLLNEIKAGDKLETTGPSGTFYHEPLIDGRDLVFLAGGSGITPFMSIIRDAIYRQRPLNMHLLYGSRSADDVIYGEELETLASTDRRDMPWQESPTEPHGSSSQTGDKSPSLNYALVVSEPSPDYAGLTGFLTADLIREVVGDLHDKTFYICGPNVMYEFCLTSLRALDVPNHKIKRELYGPPDDVTREPGWPQDLAPDTIFDVSVQGRGGIRAPAGEPLINSLERYSVVLPALCRAGECSACRTRLLSGRVFQPARTGLRESDREHGYIHACVSYPLEDLSIRI